MYAPIARSLVAIALAVSAAGAQNTIQWDRLLPPEEDQDLDPPAVRVWLDQRAVGWGDPIRVGFSVEEDAFVVVARVDWQGNLRVLYPANRNRVTLVKGGEDNYIRGIRTGGAATFLATERPGATGYVFAIASRTPMDLSRLTVRDFSNWVTGVSLGANAQRYIGDPYRVVQRFARLVSYSDDAEFDYDMEFYSVDQPRFASSAFAGFGYCSNSLTRAIMRDELSFGVFDPAGASFLDCRGLQQCFALGSYYGYGAPYGFVPGFCGGPFGQQVAVNGQNPVVTPPPIRGNGPVNPWAGDSIQRPNLDRSGQGGTTAPDRHLAIEQVRPAPVAVGYDDLSFSIPSRALRNLRERSQSGEERLPGRPDKGGTIPNPGGRPAPVMAENSGPIEWVRPPRSFDGPARGEPDRLPSRGAIRRESADFSPPNRGFDYDPPPRSGSVMFDRDIGGNRGYPPPSIEYRGGYTNGGSIYSPPSSTGIRPMTDPVMHNPGTVGGGGAPPIRSVEVSSPPPTPPASSSSGGASSAEKKPGA